MPGPVAGPQHHVPGLHGRAEEDPPVRVAAQPRRLREVVGAVRRPRTMNNTGMIFHAKLIISKPGLFYHLVHAFKKIRR